MKLKSILGIIISILGITLTIFNWLSFTIQIPETAGLNGLSCLECTYNIKGYQLGHHEHSITLMVLIIFCFMFTFINSIISLNKAKRNI